MTNATVKKRDYKHTLETFLRVNTYPGCRGLINVLIIRHPRIRPRPLLAIGDTRQ